MLLCNINIGTILFLIVLTTVKSKDLPCGKPTIQPILSKFDMRIIRGIEAKPHSWPWQVSLQCCGNGNGKHICGGTIIAPDKILTAAHCIIFVSRNPSDYSVIAGAHYISNKEEENSVNVQVAHFSTFDGFNPSKMEFLNDIIVLTLEHELTFNDHIMPVCLAQVHDVPFSLQCYVTGWGVTNETLKQPSNELKQVDILVNETTPCEQHKRFGDIFNKSKMICTDYHDGKDACHGDSGGPLVCLKNGVWTQYGIVSFGVGCGRDKEPAVYAKVSFYIEWVLHIIATTNIVTAAHINTSPIPTNQPSMNGCPIGWSSDEPNYSYICYKELNFKLFFEMPNGSIACQQEAPGATLPIFHDLSEYISYGNWHRNKAPNTRCAHQNLLGIKYNASVQNYTWLDDSKITLPIEFSESMLQGEGVYHYGSGSEWHITRKPNLYSVVCQLRQKKQSTQISLDYPKSSKCPKRSNWFYDAVSDICYYLNHQKIMWQSANNFCNAESGVSLPYFTTSEEYDSFVKLTRILLISCPSDIWLGYSGQNGIFKTVNGTVAIFTHWHDGRQPISTNLQFVSHYGDAIEYGGWVARNEMPLYFLCQCRPGSCPKN